MQSESKLFPRIHHWTAAHQGRLWLTPDHSATKQPVSLPGFGARVESTAAQQGKYVWRNTNRLFSCYFLQYFCTLFLCCDRAPRLTGVISSSGSQQTTQVAYLISQLEEGACAYVRVCVCVFGCVRVLCVRNLLVSLLAVVGLSSAWGNITQYLQEEERDASELSE